jgi:putative ATP-grasp target RiPP
MSTQAATLLVPAPELPDATRPFGMRFLVAGKPKDLTDAEDVRHYDPARQLTVTPAGDPWALYADARRGESTTDVSRDGQTVDVTDPY